MRNSALLPPRSNNSRSLDNSWHKNLNSERLLLYKLGYLENQKAITHQREACVDLSVRNKLKLDCVEDSCNGESSLQTAYSTVQYVAQNSK